MNNKEINEMKKQAIIEDMIITWENERSGSLDYILEWATAIKNNDLIELVEKAMGFLAELESVEDDIDKIMQEYEE